MPWLERELVCRGSFGRLILTGAARWSGIGLGLLRQPLNPATTTPQGKKREQTEMGTGGS